MLPLIEEFKQKLLQEYKCPSNMTNIISICFKLEDWYGSDRMDKITAEDLNRFKTYLLDEFITRNGANYRKSTAIAKLVGIKRYFAFLVEKKVISKDPTRGFDIPKKKPELPPYLPSEAEIWDLINRIDTSTSEGVRDKAVIALMSVVPLKNKEVMVLTLDQADLANKCFYPRKGSKDLAISLTDPVFEIMDKYITKARYHFVRWLRAPTDLLFVSRWGKPFKDNTLTVIFKKYNLYEKDRSRRIYPYLMRQATSNNMRLNGMKLDQIHKILDVDINTARTYTTLARNEIRAEQERHVAKIPLLKEYKEKLIKDSFYPNIVDKSLKSVIFFAKFLKSDDMKNVNPSDIERCKDYIMNVYVSHIGKRLREEAIIFRLRTIKEYFGFLCERGYLSSDPARDLEIPRAKPRFKWYQPTKEDVEEFAAKPDLYSYTGIRDHAIIRLWYAAPLKTREYKDLAVTDVDLVKKRIHWPGSQRGYLSMDEKTCKALDRYLKVSRPIYAEKSKIPTDKLFLNEWGDSFCGTSIFEVFWKYRGDKNIKPYAARHIKALDMLRKGISIEEVKKTLGLKSKRICQAYEMMVAEDTANFYKKDRFEKKVKLLKRQNISDNQPCMVK